MRVPPLRAALVAAAFALTPVLFASAAHADSLVYMNGGNVWISHGDGSSPRQVTGGPNTWSWPTEDDAGNILVAGGQGGVSAGIEDSPGSEIYRLNQQGASLATPQQTPGSMSSVGCVTYPPVSLRVAPDGRHYAYDSFFCDHFISFVGTVGGQGFTTDERMENFIFPYWVDNSDYVASSNQALFDSCDPGTGHYGCQWWVRDLGDPGGANYGYPWFADPDATAGPGNPDGWATGFDGVAVSRDHTKVATLEEDAGNWTDGAARKVVIRLWSGNGAPVSANDGSAPAPVAKCEIDLPGDPGVTAWYDNAGPTFSPDGTKLAFAAPDGVHIAGVSNLNSCSSIAAPLVIPGATQPFWSAADEAANAGYVAPPHPGPPTPGPDKTAPKIGALSISPKRFAASKKATALSARKKKHSPQGGMVRYTLSEPARVSFVVEQSIKGHKKGHACKRGGHGKACVLLVRKGTLTRTGVSGANQLAFSGRVGRRKLPAGTYKLVVRAVDAAGNRSGSKTVSFTIVRH
jgi:hypothetical protein